MGSGSGPLAITTRSAKNIWVNSGFLELYSRCFDSARASHEGARHRVSEPIVSLQPQSLADMDLMRTIKPIELLVLVSFTREADQY